MTVKSSGSHTRTAVVQEVSIPLSQSQFQIKFAIYICYSSHHLWETFPIFPQIGFTGDSINNCFFFFYQKQTLYFSMKRQHGNSPEATSPPVECLAVPSRTGRVSSPKYWIPADGSSSSSLRSGLTYLTTAWTGHLTSRSGNLGCTN